MYTIKITGKGTMTLSKELEEYLRKERVLTKAVRNIKELWRKLEREDFTLHYIDTLFIWDETPEGRTFWSELDKRQPRVEMRESLINK